MHSMSLLTGLLTKGVLSEKNSKKGRNETPRNCSSISCFAHSAIPGTIQNENFKICPIHSNHVNLSECDKAEEQKWQVTDKCVIDFIKWMLFLLWSSQAKKVIW